MRDDCVELGATFASQQGGGTAVPILQGSLMNADVSIGSLWASGQHGADELLKSHVDDSLCVSVQNHLSETSVKYSNNDESGCQKIIDADSPRNGFAQNGSRVGSRASLRSTRSHMVRSEQASYQDTFE